jgi:L-alanine-DL-glutamate epimerase-like enolase superfamily enzyme
MADGTIVDVRAATVRCQLPAPVVFGDWVMTDREYVVVRLLLDDGTAGWSFTLTRDGSVADHVRRTLAGIYTGTCVHDREATFRTAWKRSPASHAAGIGLRALSVMDLAAWDAAARHRDVSVPELLSGAPSPLPATAIIGYPPGTTGPAEIADQVRELHRTGWRRFKAPVAASPDLTASRLRAARQAAPEAWLGCDAAWTYDSVDDAVHFLREVEDVGLAWFEDVFPPGDAHLVRELRRRVSTPIAMGDEQGGAYYPQALLDLDAVDVVRVDLTCMGGITGGRGVVDECLRRGVAFAPHMFAHVHSQVFSAWGHHVPIEWGIPWSGVDPYADSLARPVISDGLMVPLEPGPGFGDLVNGEWLGTQDVDDPQGLFGADVRA